MLMGSPAQLTAPSLESELYRLYRDFFDKAEKKHGTTRVA
jgi:hypothetical protein